MSDYIEERVLDGAQFIIENATTIRATAQKLQVSKSCVHTDLTERLPKLNYALYRDVRDVLNTNLKERSIRGGYATQAAYKRRGNRTFGKHKNIA